MAKGNNKRAQTLATQCPIFETVGAREIAKCHRFARSNHQNDEQDQKGVFGSHWSVSDHGRCILSLPKYSWIPDSPESEQSKISKRFLWFHRHRNPKWLTTLPLPLYSTFFIARTYYHSILLFFDHQICFCARAIASHLKNNPGNSRTHPYSTSSENSARDFINRQKWLVSPSRTSSELRMIRRRCNGN